MKLLRSLATCVALAVAATVIPGPLRANAESLPLLIPRGASVSAGEVVQVKALFIEGPLFGTITSFNSVRLTVTDGLTLSNGSRTLFQTGITALAAIFDERITARSTGVALIEVIGTSSVPGNAVVNQTVQATVVVNPATTVTPALPPTPPAPPPAAPTPAAPTPQVGGNQAPTAIGSNVIVRKNTATAITLKGKDPEAARLTYSVVDFPENGRLSGRAPNLTYIPDSGFSGTDAFSFTVSDGVTTSEAAVVSITVTSAKKVVRKVTRKKR